MDSSLFYSLTKSTHKLMTKSVSYNRANNEENKQNLSQLKRENKRLKIENQQLTHKYEKMKIFHFNQILNLQNQLSEYQTFNNNLNEEKNMLKSRIKFLQKEKYPSKTLSRSVRIDQSKRVSNSTKYLTPSDKPFKKKSLPKQGNQCLTHQTLILNTSSITQMQDILSVQTIQGCTLISQDLNENESINEIKFDNKLKNRKALIQDQCQTERDYCYHHRCIQNYHELQSLRQNMISFSIKLLNLYNLLEFSFHKKFDSKEVINFKIKMQKISQTTQNNDFIYKVKPMILIQEVSKKIQEFRNGTVKVEDDHFQLNKISNLINQLKKQTQILEMEDNDEQIMDYEAEQKQIRRRDKQIENSKLQLSNLLNSIQSDKHQCCDLNGPMTDEQKRNIFY